MLWGIGNLTVSVEDHTHEEAQWLSSFLSYVKRSYNGRTNTGREDLTTMFNWALSEFPTGFARSVYKAAIGSGLSVEYEDRRVPPCEPDPDADLSWLRTHPAVEGEIKHQIEAVEAVVKHKRGIVWAPTGFGKTEVSLGLTRAIPCRWLFLVHKVDLLKQTADRYSQRTGLKAGIVGDGQFDVPSDCRFVVCSFQTAYRGYEGGKRRVIRLIEDWAQGLAVDECHAIGADTFWNTVMRTANAYYRVGFSGTPLARGDEKNLRITGGLGPVIYRIMPRTLIDLGLLASPTIRMLPMQHTPKGTTWRGVYSNCIVKNTARNQLVADLIANRVTRPCLVFVHRVGHGRDLTKRLEKAGLNARFAWGEKSTYQRKELLAQLERGYLDALVCNDIFHEGIDVPSLRSVVVAGAMKSKIAVVQRMGRGMRATTSKDTFEVWDIEDRGCGCTKNSKPVDDDPLFDDPRAPTSHTSCRWLERHTKERRKAYEQEGFLVLADDDQLRLDL